MIELNWPRFHSSSSGSRLFLTGCYTQSRKWTHPSPTTTHLIACIVLRLCYPSILDYPAKLRNYKTFCIKLNEQTKIHHLPQTMNEWRDSHGYEMWEMFKLDSKICISSEGHMNIFSRYLRKEFQTDRSFIINWHNFSLSLVLIFVVIKRGEKRGNIIADESLC